MTGARAADHGAPTAATFRAVMSRFATGVGIMTTMRDGVPHGMTANAFSSVSLVPPLVLVCVERSTVMAAEVVGSGAFAMTFLGADGDELSDRFAASDRPLAEAMFEGVDTRVEATGAPIIQDGVAWLDCRVWNTYDGGDHLIVVGEVVALDVGPADDPLLYFGSGYRRLAG